LQKEQNSVVNTVYRQWKNFSAVSLTPANSLSPVSLTPVDNLLPVSLTPAITFFPGVIDTGQKKPKSLKFVAGFNDTAEKLFTGVNDTAEKFLRRCQRHRRIESPANISLPTPKNEK
jgi:hypothetical protein